MRKRDEAKIRKIKEKAIEMIVEFGFNGLSMKKLADASSVSPATIYIYYSSREDLLSSLYIDVFDEANRAAIEGFSSDMALYDGLRIIWENRFRYAMQYPFHALFLDQFVNSPLVSSVQQKESPKHREIMFEFYNALVAKGEIECMPIKVYWAIAFYPLFQLIKFRLQKGVHFCKNEDVDESMLQNCLEKVVKALRKSDGL